MRTLKWLDLARNNTVRLVYEPPTLLRIRSIYVTCVRYFVWNSQSDIMAWALLGRENYHSKSPLGNIQKSLFSIINLKRKNLSQFACIFTGGNFIRLTKLRMWRGRSIFSILVYHWHSLTRHTFLESQNVKQKIYINGAPKENSGLHQRQRITGTQRKRGE